MTEKANSLFDRVFDGFKKTTPALFAVLICTGLILFLPQSIMKKTGLDSIPNNWKVILGISFFLSLAIIFAIVGFGVCKFIRKKYNRYKLKRHRMKQLIGLTQKQKEILITLLESDEKRIMLYDLSGDTRYLMNKEFIYRPSQAADFDDNGNMVLYYVPYPWLMDMYQKNPKVL